MTQKTWKFSYLQINWSDCSNCCPSRKAERQAREKPDLTYQLLTTRNSARTLIFLRRLITISPAAQNLDNFVRLNVSARFDIQWWSHFSCLWNGTSKLVRFNRANPQFTVTSDAPGSWDCGACEGEKWLIFEWPSNTEASHISVREIVPVVMSAALWGQF